MSIKHTFILVMATILLAVGGCGCITLQPKPVQENQAQDEGCTACVQLCQVAGPGVLVCEATCKEKVPCKVPGSRKRSEADPSENRGEKPSALMAPPIHVKQLPEPDSKKSRIYEL